MMLYGLLFQSICLFKAIHSNEHPTSDKQHEDFFTVKQDYPKVMIAFNARNSAPLLPWFLGQLENLDYPKDQLSLRIRTDHNEDKTVEVLERWLKEVKDLYDDVDFESDESETIYDDEKAPFDWSTKRIQHVMNLKQEALDVSRRSKDVEYLFLLDTDAFLLEPRVLRELVTWQKPIIAPLLNVYNSNFSNFWAAIDNNGFYSDSPNYYPIVSHQDPGCHHIAMVHTAILIDVKDPRAKLLAFTPERLEGYKGVFDELVVFGESTDVAAMQMYVLNTAFWGWMLYPQADWHGVLDLAESMTYLLADLVDQKVNSLPLLYSPYIEPEWPEKERLDCDKIYVINLERRPERKYRMDFLFKILGLDVTYWPATDGLVLNDSVLAANSIKVMSIYEDPYYKRPMKFGEVGCFLSHYRIWKDVVDNGYKQVMVLEDDVRFHAYFRWRVLRMLRELTNKEKEGNFEWDLIYLGRKYMGWRFDGSGNEVDETKVDGMTEMYTVDYSYWTVGYLLSARGAQRLMDAKPLQNVLPVDEFLPIMYGRQPYSQWIKPYENAQKIQAFVSYPEFISPSHYTFQKGYFTDTEASEIVFSEKSEDQDAQMLTAHSEL